MKIAFFMDVYEPESGGAYTLINRICQQIRGELRSCEYVFLYRGSGKQPYLTTIEGEKWINVNKAISLWEKLISKIKRLIGIKVYNVRVDNACKKEKIDLVWFLTPTDADISFPYVYTVWDLGHRTLPAFPEVSSCNRWEIREKMYQKMLPRASYILSGNSTGKKEIIECYSVMEELIKIVQFPLPAYCFGEEKKPGYIADLPYFIYPAQFWPHKNHIRIIEALHILRDKTGMKPIVYFSGSDQGNLQYIKEQIAKYDLEDQVIILGFIRAEELKYLVSHATAMIYASLLGPNNLPPMEAAYLGCPVLITDIDGHKEEMGNAALYFNGCDANDLALKMQKIMENQSMRQEMIAKGKLLAKKMASIDYAGVVVDVLRNFELQQKCWKN